MKVFFNLLSFITVSVAFGQYGGLDTTFLPNSYKENTEQSGFNGTVIVSSLQSDQKIIVAGQFGGYGLISSPAIFRFNADGTPDSTFHSPFADSSGQIMKMILLPNGKIIISGFFVSGPFINLARLNSDGSIDTTFNHDVTPDGSIPCLSVLPNGNIAVGGGFQHLGTVALPGVGILDSNGFLINTFSPPNFSGIWDIAALPDGHLLVSSFNHSLISLLPDGTLDPVFDTTALSGQSGAVAKIQLLSDGKVMLYGSISINSIANGLMRINANGTIDNTFNSGVPYLSYQRHCAAFTELTDGSYLVGGVMNYSNYDIQHLNHNGTIDPNFVLESNLFGNGGITCILMANNIVVGGGFYYADKAKRNRLMQIDPVTRQLVPDYYKLAGPSDNILSMKVLGNGKILVGGEFGMYDGLIKPVLVRLHPNGLLDTTFHYSGNIMDSITGIAVQTDGKIIVYNRYHATRLTENGDPDPEFPMISPSSGVYFRNILPDDQGRITFINASYISRTMSDLTSDPSFQPFSGSAIVSSARTSNNKLILSGNMVNNGLFGPILIRLNEDGTPDSTFTLPTNIFLVSNPRFLTDAGDNIYVENAGENAVQHRLKKLLPDGSNDSSFHFRNNEPITSPVGRLLCFDPSDRFYYADYSGSSLQINRYFPSGERDYTFPTVNYSNSINSIVAGMDFLIAGGDVVFTLVNNDTVNGIFRLTDCIGPVLTDHCSAYQNLTWIDGITYTQDTMGVVVSHPNPGSCDSLIILDLHIFDPELHVFTSPSDTIICSGTATLSIDALAPYTFIVNGQQHSSNSYFTFTNLCPGIYSAEAYDAAGNYYATNFVVASDTNFYNQNPSNNNPIVDSLSTTVENCLIDYSTITDILIDSAWMSNDSLYVITSIYDAFDTTSIESSFYLGSDTGNYIFQIYLYCPVKSSGHYAVFQFGCHYSPNGVEVLALPELAKRLKIYPNPATELLNVELNGFCSDFEIRDLQGKVVLHSFSSTNKIDIRSLESGVYVLIAKYQGEVLTGKFVKL